MRERVRRDSVPEQRITICFWPQWEKLLSTGRTISLPREQEKERSGKKRKGQISETDQGLSRPERKGNWQTSSTVSKVNF